MGKVNALTKFKNMGKNKNNKKKTSACCDAGAGPNKTENEAKVVELPSSDEEEEKVPEVKPKASKDLKNPKETKEVKEDNKVEKIEETEKKSETSPLDEWFAEAEDKKPEEEKKE